MFEKCTSPQDINSYQKVAIEFIFIDGFYTSDVNYYSYSELGKDNMLDRQQIIKEFNAKLRQHEVEKNNFDINVPYPVYQQGEVKNIGQPKPFY